jgi:hypothetical protein
VAHGLLSICLRACARSSLGGYAPGSTSGERAHRLRSSLEPLGRRVGTVPRPLFRSCLEERWNSIFGFSKGH